MVGRILYWVAVFAISLLLVVGLILFIESRDDSSLEESARPGVPAALVT
jgi:hypothetical protein